MRIWLAILALVLVPVTAFAQPGPPGGGNVAPTAPGPVAPTPPGNVGPTPPGGVVPPTSNPPFPVRGVTPPDPRASAGPHPMLPWSHLNQNVYGRTIGYFEVAAREVTIFVPVPGAETLPLQFQAQTVVVPGYYVTETTTGYVYPERWTLEQANVGVYQWRLLPPEFLRK